MFRQTRDAPAALNVQLRHRPGETQLPENAELASYRPVAGKTADRSDADFPVRPFLGGVEIVSLIDADARTASEIRAAEGSRR
jgi:hypothetical protein